MFDFKSGFQKSVWFGSLRAFGVYDGEGGVLCEVGGLDEGLCMLGKRVYYC